MAAFRIEDLSLHKLIDFYSVWPALVCIGVALLFAWTPICRLADSPPSYQPSRIVTVDGLRGLLALTVVLHHVAIYHVFLQQPILVSDAWSSPASAFYETSGLAAMAMFFMVTGYLFWARVIRDRGRPEWKKLYIGRLFRLGPLYLTVLAVSSICDHLSRTPAPPTPVLKQAATWSLLGLSVYKDSHEFLAGVTWSLQSEWLFYLSLPLLALFVMRWGRDLGLSLTLLAVCLVLVGGDVHHAGEGAMRIHLMRPALFFAGMVCASLHAGGMKPALPDGLTSGVVVALVAAALQFREMYGPAPLLLVGSAFFLIASGCSLFGLLRSRPAIRLGDVSYGIYLAQGLALAAFFRPPALRSFALSSPWHHWSLALAAILCLVVAATATHVLIERPGIALGRHILRRSAVSSTSSL